MISRRISRAAIDRTLNYGKSSQAILLSKADRIASTHIDFHFPYTYEGPVRYPTLGQWQQGNDSTFYHPIGRVEFALMAQGQLRGYDVRVGERATVRDVPYDASARAERA